MSLEECKRLAEEKRERDKELQKGMRRSRGMVDGEDVKLCLSLNPLPWPLERWVVCVTAYGFISSEYFKEEEKDSAERYFEGLTLEYGLKEEEK